MLLKITLEAMLQSWGLPKVNGDYFPTGTMPTKTGLVGLIGCVMGIPRNDARLEALMSELCFSVVPYSNDGIMTDFHVINVTEDRPMYQANGEKTKREQANSIITKRGYIQSGKFDVYISGDISLLKDIENAFLHPHWTPYLGRKCCPVSAPLIPAWVEAPDAAARDIS